MAVGKMGQAGVFFTHISFSSRAASTARKSRSMTTEHIHATPEIGKSIRAGGFMTNYHEAGTGTPVILIHGSGPGVSAWSNWRLTIPYLAERLHVFAYDQLGFGYSDLSDQHTYNLEGWTDHLLSFMEAVGVERAHLIGDSMGAAVALAAALKHPERVHKLILMGPMGVRFSITEGLDAVWGYTPGVANMKKLIDIFAYDRKLVTDALAEQRYQSSIRPGMQEAFSSMFPAPRQHGVDALAAYESRIREIQAPVLLFHGREDRVIPLETSLNLFHTLDNAQLHVFSRCGHWTQTEYAHTFNRLVRDFLTKDVR